MLPSVTVTAGNVNVPSVTPAPWGSVPTMPDILHQLVIEATAKDVYRALTEPDGLGEWWTRDVEAEPELGSVAAFGFHDRATHFKMKVEELVPHEFVRWHCVGGHPEWEHTEITFDITEDEGRTTLYFAHRGWESTDGILAFCSFDWARYLISLKSYLETGTGSPHSGKADDS